MLFRNCITSHRLLIVLALALSALIVASESSQTEDHNEGSAPGGNSSAEILDAGSEANTIAQGEINAYRVAHHLTAPAQLMTFTPALILEAQTCVPFYTFQTPKDPLDFSVKNFALQCTTVADLGGNEIIFEVDKPETEDNLVFAEVVQKWYMDQVNQYSFTNPKYSSLETSQGLTQILWKLTKNFGCACDTTKNPQMKYSCSCIFTPAGNVRSGFGDAGLATYKANVPAK